ncbi:MAG: hypothetical protein WAT70_04665 [Rhizobiaceae bacterium]
MSVNAKSIVDGAANAAMMTAFCFQPEGVVVAAAIAGAEALFNIIWDALDTPDPGNALVTQNGLDNAVAEITQNVKGIVNSSAFLTTYNGHFTNVRTIQNGLSAALDDGVTSIDLVLKGGAKLTADEMPALDANWSDALAQVALTVTNLSSDLYKAQAFVETTPDHKYNTIDLYVYTVGIFILGCRAAMLIEFAAVLHKQGIMTARNDKKAQDNAAQYTLWAIQNPDKPDDQNPFRAPLMAFADAKEVAAHSVYVVLFHSRMKQFIAYLQGFCDDLEGLLSAVGTKIDARLGKVAVKGGGLSWHFEDSETGASSNPTNLRSFAGLQAEIYKGTLVPPILATDIDPLMTAGCDWAKLAELKAILNSWKVGQSAAADFIKSYSL